MMTIFGIFLLLILLVNITLQQQGNSYPKNCFFSTQKTSDGVWWLVDPNGKPLVSKSVDSVQIYGDYCPALNTSPYYDAILAKFPTNTVEQWTNEALSRLAQWKFNNAGSWSGDSINAQIPYYFVLGIAESANKYDNLVADYFDPAFVTTAKNVVQQIVSQKKDDNLLIAYYSDNELFWGQDWRSNRSLLLTYMTFPDGAPGKQVALNQLTATYDNNIQLLNEAWGININSFEDLSQVTFAANDWGTAQRQRDESTFLFAAATQYYKICRDTIKAEDPYHLLFGNKFPGFPPPQQDVLINVAAIYTDGLAFDYYDNIHMSLFDHAYNVTNFTKPLLVAEFSFKSTASGLPCTIGAGTPVPTLYDRALGFQYYVMNLTLNPAVIGYAWFEYMDEPALGRPDGENSNFGMVAINDTVYIDMAEMAAKINPLAEVNHAKGSMSSVPNYLSPYCVPYLQCPGNCSGNGCCDYTTGVCTCFSGYSFVDCSQNNTQLLWNFATNGDSSTVAYHDDGWTDGIVGYRSSNVNVTNGQLVLTIDNNGCPSACYNEPYASGGWNTLAYYGYGLFTFSNVKVLAVSGAYSVLQIYNGSASDSILMIIQGNSPNILRLAYVINGTWNSLPNVDLPFDASQGYHTYSFNRTTTSIVFYVDGVAVSTVNATRSNPLPSAPGRLSIELYANNDYPSWYGTFNYTGPVYTYVGGVSYSMLPSKPVQCPPPPFSNTSSRLISNYAILLIAMAATTMIPLLY